MPQSRSTALPRHQRKDKWGTNKAYTNATCETKDVQIKKNCNRGIVLEWLVEKLRWGWGCGAGQGVLKPVLLAWNITLNSKVAPSSKLQIYVRSARGPKRKSRFFVTCPTILQYTKYSRWIQYLDTNCLFINPLQNNCGNSYGQCRPWSVCTDGQADLSLRRALMLDVKCSHVAARKSVDVYLFDTGYRPWR